MSITNRQMDEAVERAEAMNLYALAHSSDNSPEYVVYRYTELFGAHHFPVPVRPGATLLGQGRLFPASIRSKKGNAFEWRSAWPELGIVVTLWDEDTGELGKYRIEINGLNGVEVVSRHTH